MPHIGEDGTWTVLDDFTTRQLTDAGDPIVRPYLGEDPNQTVLENPGTANKIFTILGGSGDEIYWEFQPYADNGDGYTFPGGYTQDHATGGSPDWTAINRLQFLFRPDAAQARRSDGGAQLEVGTYIRPHGTSGVNDAGDHYYHQFDPNFIANKWHLLVLNRHPQHQVGGSGGTNYADNPESPLDYYDGLTRWYFDNLFDNTGETWSFKALEVGIVSGTEDAEISSIIAVYTGTRYEVSWAAVKNSARTFDIRYSSASMKPSSFTSGTDGGTASNPNSDYTGTFWASPNMSEASPGIWIAIRRQGASANAFNEFWLPTGMIETADSNSTRTPVIGAAALAGVAPRMALGVRPVGAIAIPD